MLDLIKIFAINNKFNMTKITKKKSSVVTRLRNYFITGIIVLDATIPGKWAAPPAPAIITFSPRSKAFELYVKSRSGVLCADMIFVSKLISS